jgi:hypothetical protein
VHKQYKFLHNFLSALSKMNVSNANWRYTMSHTIKTGQGRSQKNLPLNQNATQQQPLQLPTTGQQQQISDSNISQHNGTNSYGVEPPKGTTSSPKSASSGENPSPVSRKQLSNLPGVTGVTSDNQGNYVLTFRSNVTPDQKNDAMRASSTFIGSTPGAKGMTYANEPTP